MAKENNKKLIIWALVALIIGVVIGMVITNATTGDAKNMIKSTQELKNSNNKFEAYTLNEIKGSVICNCSNGRRCGSLNYNYEGTIGEITVLCAQCCAELDATCDNITIKTKVTCTCANNATCYTAEVTQNYGVAEIVQDCGACCSQRRNSSFGTLTWT